MSPDRGAKRDILKLSPSLATGLQSAPSCWTALCQDRAAHILLAVGPDLYLLDHAACSAVVRALSGSEMEGVGEAVGEALRKYLVSSLACPRRPLAWPLE